MWYEASYRRHLCDMHIEDWDEAFLSAFSPRDYHENLLRAKIQNAMLYFQSHVGYCYYPTQTGHMHRAFAGREDAMRQLAGLCAKSGISVTGYYSLIYNNWAHDNHPGWRMLDAQGRSVREHGGGGNQSFSDALPRRYGLCCPNNPQYRDFVFAQMKEINEYFDFDGMFFDMPFWPHMCYCDSCRARWRGEAGGDLPEKEDWEDGKWLLHVRKRREWMGEFTRLVTSKMKRLRPSVTVAHNFATAVLPGWGYCCAEPVNNACDYAGGDLYGGIFEQSFTCKFYRSITQNQPFEYMFSRCEPNLSKHTITKSDDVMAASVFLTCAHQGATLVIDAIDPVGTMDARVYERIGGIFERESAYEPYFGGEMMEDIGVYYSLKSKFALNGNAYANHACAVQTVRTLIENHLCAGVTGGWGSLSKYKAVVASCLTSQDAYDNDRLAAYVENGGVLYVSGGDDRALVEALVGGTVKGVTAEDVVYIAPKDHAGGMFEYFNQKYPLPFNGRVPILEGADPACVIAEITLPYTVPGERRFASIHSNPPGTATSIPAVIVKNCGKGVVIWSAAPIEHLAAGEYRRIFLNLLFKGLGEQKPGIRCGAPKNVEVTGFRKEASVLVSAVLLHESDRAQPVAGFEVRVLSEAAPRRVVLLPEGQAVPFIYEDGYACFHTRTLHIFDMYEIIF